MRKLILLACCCILPLLAGCSATRLVYDHLDTLLRWRAGDFVDLTPAQKRNFDAEVYPVWTWHRRTQLPLYAAELRQLAAQAQAGPLGRARLEALAAHIDGYWSDLVLRALPGYARLHADLSDAQVADLVLRIGKASDRRMHKRLRHDDQRRRADLVEDMNERLEEWIGEPDAAQRRLVEQWAAQIRLVTPEQYQRRRGSLDRYTVLLAGRAQPGFEQRMGEFLLTPQGGEEAVAQDLEERQRWLQLLADLSATLDPEQRAHLVKHLLGYAQDFEALAAEKLPPAP